LDDGEGGGESVQEKKILKKGGVWERVAGKVWGTRRKRDGIREEGYTERKTGRQIDVHQNYENRSLKEAQKKEDKEIKS